jgi:hypothetical protein
MGGCIVHNHYRTEAPLSTPEPRVEYQDRRAVVQQAGAPGFSYGAPTQCGAPVAPTQPYEPVVSRTETRCECRPDVEALAVQATPRNENGYGPVTPREFASDDPADWLE